VALLHAQNSSHALAIRQSQLAIIAVERAHDSELCPLWNIKDEVASVVTCAQGVNVKANAECMCASATTTEVSSQFESAQLVHIACHGIQDQEAPLRSRFCLSDGNISVQDLMKLDLKNAFLIFLSACETAKGDRKQPDQTIHLAAVMLFVGFKSVVATLWYVCAFLSYPCVGAQMLQGDER
jgi:CHAT domain-containing protein